MKKTFAVIGLGSFGSAVAGSLGAAGEPVLAIDRDADRVGEIKDEVARAVIADARDREALVDLALGECAGAVVSLGDSIEASALVVLYLSELKVPRIIAKATSRDHARLLEKVGATEVVWPEEDSALLLARRLRHKNLLEYIEVASRIVLAEIEVPSELVGRTLRDSDLRGRFGVQVVFVHAQGDTTSEKSLPDPDRAFRAGDTLIAVGERDSVDRMLGRSGA